MQDADLIAVGNVTLPSGKVRAYKTQTKKEIGGECTSECASECACECACECAYECMLSNATRAPSHGQYLELKTLRRTLIAPLLPTYHSKCITQSINYPNRVVLHSW